MAVQSFLARVSGRTKQVAPATASTGAADGGKIVALDSTGKVHTSMLPVGVGESTIMATAGEELSAGKFVNFFATGAAFSVRLADNSNNRPANGFVLDAASVGQTATVYPLDESNSSLTGLTLGAGYWLGTAGGVVDTAPDESTSAAGTISQYLGIARSATELLTTDDSYVVL